MKKIIECVPNFSEGRDLDKIEKIVDPFRGKGNVRLLDYQRDKDHNRLVVTAIGDPETLSRSVIEAIGRAIELIDMREHRGQHPRMGAVDVVPFIPIKNLGMTEAIDISRNVAKAISDKYEIPVFLYERSATIPERQNMATIRKGEFEGMVDKIKDPKWRPDFGPDTVHSTAGVTAVGARMPLVAFNVNLDTADLEIANAIARKVRYISGGLRYCKGIGIALKQRGIVQVSMNMTDYTKTALYRSYELVRIEARRYGINVVGSEIVGLVPMEALIDVAAYYLGLEEFAIDQVLESRLME
jgi:glutamate formiminotransferase